MRANISWINDQLATGGDFSYVETKAILQFEDLLSQDIDLVIDCRIEADDADMWEGSGVDYLHLPTDDKHGWSIPSEHFDHAVEAAMEVIEAGGRVFAHCHMGVNRGPSTAYAIMLEMGMDPCEAFDLIRTKRRQAGIVYAEDALRAHYLRHDIDEDVRVLSRHINRVMTAKERGRIQHIIRDNHRRDREEVNLVKSMTV